MLKLTRIIDTMRNTNMDSVILLPSALIALSVLNKTALIIKLIINNSGSDMLTLSGKKGWIKKSMERAAVIIEI